MTGIVLWGVLRSQRVVGVVLLSLAVIGVVASNRPQAPGDTLAAASLLMVPVHAWAALVTATGTDTPTREAFVAALGLKRVIIGHVLAAMVVGAVAGLAVFATAVGARVMSPPPSTNQWAAAVMAAGAGLVLGVAIGTVAGPPVINRRAARVLVFVWLIVLAPLALPLLQVARALGNSPSGEVIDSVTGPVAVTTGAALALLVTGLMVATRRT